MQIWVQDFSRWDALGHYRWAYGLSDSEGNIISRYTQMMIGQMKFANEAGELVYPSVTADPRGGTLVLSGMKMASPEEVKHGVGVPGPSILTQSVRYGPVTGKHLLFQITPILSAQTRTDADPTNKVTGGAKAGASGGIFSGEVSGSVEHGFASGSTSDAHLGTVTNIQVVWLPK